jgi:hypothetical protein
MSDKELLENLHQFPPRTRRDIIKQLMELRSKELIKITVPWIHWAPCEVNVLLVTDGFLHFGYNEFGFSEFIEIFKELERDANIHISYNVTLAHRSDPAASAAAAVDPMLTTEPSIVERIIDFKFDTSVSLASFDQVWLFGTANGTSIPGPALSAAEISAIERYMDSGGGLFATGDHGPLGKQLCEDIPRVKDMRIWDGSGNPEVSMTQSRRNDTNRPSPGDSYSMAFSNQQDNIPQNITVRMYDDGLPHPLLSISPTKRPSGVIDIMPDHPHEGECKAETSFTVTNSDTGEQHTISTQNIATSLVIGGSRTNSKDPTDPHCFPSIGVFDGRVANVGRIVVDSTWHHFVNINLIGRLSINNDGLDASDIDVVKQYFKNISLWMTRSRNMICLVKSWQFEAVFSSQVIEAAMDQPDIDIDKIDDRDLYHVGMLAKELLSESLTPALAHEFLRAPLQKVAPDLFGHLDYWSPGRSDIDALEREWLRVEPIAAIALGAGLIALAKNQDLFTKRESNANNKKIDSIFANAVEVGTRRAIARFQSVQRSGESLLKM